MDQQLKDAYKKYGDELVKELTKQLKLAGKVASGKLIKSLKPDIREIAGSINVSIKGESYLKYVDKGRKPGKYPNINKIAQWCRIKDIPVAAAFPIARHIFKFGIKPTNVIARATAIVNLKAKKQLEKAIAISVEKDIINTYNQTK